MFRKRTLLTRLVLAVLSILILYLTANINKFSQKENLYLVTRVIDGDTIVVNNSIRVRYIGIDAPELGRDPECFGQEAKAYNEKLVLGRLVKMEKDVSETDQYGRLLRYVYLDNTMVNKKLVEEGYAFAATFPPDIKYQALFLQAERMARENSKGLWNKNNCNYN
ncbi:MAG: thermonuclease [Patescibacteria group bacterium]|nr:MAG: thermonuclease [Patescibacteria group bacterium]